MKKVVSLMMALVVSASVFATGNETVKVKTQKVNVAKSTFKWLGKKFTGEHNGAVSFTGGSVQIDGGKLVGGEFTIDMNSITCADLTNAEYNGKLIGHLKSEDFFNTAKFGTSTMKITKVQSTGNNNYQVTADLTIKGETNAVTFPATVVVGKSTTTATANFDIDRTRWNIKYGSGLLGIAQDKTINDKFNVAIYLVAGK